MTWSKLSPQEKALAVTRAQSRGHRSARQIAAAIGAPSRDAVIGVCYRNGIKLAGKSGPSREAAE